MEVSNKNTILSVTKFNLLAFAGFTDFVFHAMTAIDEYGASFKAEYGDTDLEITNDDDPNIMCWGLYARSESRNLTWIADLATRDDAMFWQDVLLAVTSKREIENSAYSIFLMVEAARLHGLIDKDLEYDRTWEVAEGMYREFKASAFNNLALSEMDCIQAWVGAERQKMQSAPPIAALTEDRKFLMVYTEKRPTARIHPDHAASDQRKIDLGIKDEYAFVDHITCVDTEKEAIGLYELVIQRGNTYSASVCKVLKSTDY